MKNRIVIPTDHLPTRIPTWQTLLMVMALDYYKAPGWAWGIGGTLMGLVWIGALIIMFGQQKEKPLPGYGEQGKP